MSRLPVLLVLIAAVCPAVAGCRLLSMQRPPSEDLLSEPLLEALKGELSNDQLRVNPQWSLVEAIRSGELPEGRRRWSFGDDAIHGVLRRIDTFGDGSSGLHSGPAGNIYLAVLAEEDSLAGWNAAILWGLRDPESAQEVADVLKEIVSERLYYDSKSGERIARPPLLAASDSGEEHEHGSDGTEAVDDAVSGAASKSPGEEEATEESNSDPAAEKERAARLAEELASRREEEAEPTSTEEVPIWRRFFAGSTEVMEKGEPVAVSQVMRAAAAEAWCRVLAVSEPEAIDGLAPAGRLLEKGSLNGAGAAPLPTTVRGALFTSLGVHVPPAAIPGLDETLQPLDTEELAPLALRRAAIETCLLYQLQHGAGVPEKGKQRVHPEFDEMLWPASVLNLQYDPEASIRESLGIWLAVAGHPLAETILESQLLDLSHRVREAAGMHLGMLGTRRARNILLQRIDRPEERMRGLILRGLAWWGPAELRRFADDESDHVREALAEELGDWPEVAAAEVLEKLLVDANSQVQSAALSAVEVWPDELAIPLLLHGLQNSSRATRLRCLGRLRKRAGRPFPFPVDAPHAERRLAAGRLAAEWDLPTHFLPTILRDAGRPAGGEMSDLQVAEIRSQLQDLANSPEGSPEFSAALERLMQLTGREVPVIERILAEPHPSIPQPHPPVIHRDLLPAISESYRALLMLESPDIRERRRGARLLFEASTRGSLSPTVVRRIHQALAFEQDRLVWQSVMSAVIEDGTEATDQIALLALNQNWADIRILGCRYIARHAKPEYALWLLNLDLINDPNSEVKLAATEAAGLCRNPIILDGVAGSTRPEGEQSPQSDPEKPSAGLRPLLNDPDPRVRFAAAVSMARLGDPQATQELIRRSYHESPELRSEVVAQMGLTGRTHFVDHLIQLGWTESSPQVQRAILESLNELVPLEARPEGLEREQSAGAKIRLWNRWKHQQRFDAKAGGRSEQASISFEATSATMAGRRRGVQ